MLVIRAAPKIMPPQAGARFACALASAMFSHLSQMVDGNSFSRDGNNKGGELIVIPRLHTELQTYNSTE
jgi:hypothetical protein